MLWEPPARRLARWVVPGTLKEEVTSRCTSGGSQWQGWWVVLGLPWGTQALMGVFATSLGGATLQPGGEPLG